MLSLSIVAQDPKILTETITTARKISFIFRPLENSDVDNLGKFLQELSPETRRMSIFSGYDIETAQTLCDAIARYDKLRFVLETVSGGILGLLEFSFAITKGDIARYASYNIILSPEKDCRFGPTLSDNYQNKGIGSLVMPFIKTVAGKFGKNRIILWGGVFSNNVRAIRYYEKNGFRKFGTFKDENGTESIDMMLEL
jgi:diamine N-acetyltransferase